MFTQFLRLGSTRAPSVLLLLTLTLFGSRCLFPQDQPPPPQLPPPNQTLTPDQLNDLVAPIALYPDPLLSQIMVASTYPLEVVQAYQWLQRNPGLNGPALTQAAQQQNWDPSIQALVVFPDVLKRLNDDVTWTTNSGQRVPGAAAGRDGRGTAHAAKSPTRGQTGIHAAVKW